LIGADLGAGVIRQRIARPAKGKSSGFRTMILCQPDTREGFVYGFAKNERANITQDELAMLEEFTAEVRAAYDESRERRRSLTIEPYTTPPELF
jgi:hypothetical protein